MTNQTLTALNAAANQILAVIAPTVARLVTARVIVREQDTAATNGIVILMPQIFCGEDVIARSDVAVGLLAHELAHFTHPLDVMTRLEQEQGVPHWLINIVLDIQGESVIERIFPAFGYPLRIVRRIVRARKLRDYETTMHNPALSFAARANAAALRARFYEITVPYKPFALGDRRIDQFLQMLDLARETNASDLPDLIVKIMRAFPELKRTSPPPNQAGSAGGQTSSGSSGDASSSAEQPADDDSGQVNPLDAVTATGKVLPAVQREAGAICVVGGTFNGTEAIQMVSATRQPADPAAILLSRQIATRFDRPKGELDICAPGRIDRLELARGSLVPFSMSVRPGVDRPAPKVVLCLDKSVSMARGDKWPRARLAAQAIALAIQEQEGDVRAVLFAGEGYCADEFSADLLFSDEAPDGGSTSFLYLSIIWRQYPDHHIILVTDGDGELPDIALPGDKARTVVVLIPPDCDGTKMQQIAREVVTVDNLDDLPFLLGLLIPRTMLV